MRVSIYTQELTDEVRLEQKISNTGVVYSAVQFMMHSSDKLHYRPGDDDRTTVAFWLPRSKERREALAQTFERAAAIIRSAPPETGLD